MTDFRGLVAHRGAMQEYPENTLPAIRAALEAGAPYVEFDLQMNADGDFVVIHDDNFKRTAGVMQSVLTSDTRLCRTFSVHYPDRFADRFKPIQVSMLGEILALFASCPGATALVEIKCESLEYWGVVEVMNKLLRQLEPYRHQCILISYSASSIRYAKKHSKLRTGWVLEHFNEAYRSAAESLAADYLVCNREHIPDGTVLWPEFRSWMLYDIMDPFDALTCVEMGVELIETGDIAGLISFFGQRESSPS